MKLSFHGEADINNNARSIFLTVSSLQDSRRCRFKKETVRNYFNFLNEKFRKLNNFIHHQFSFKL